MFSNSLLNQYFSVKFPQITTPTTSNQHITGAALLEQIRDIVNSNGQSESDDSSSSAFSKSPFQRTVNWTFENMKMLIGSDLPIFGDDKHPAVSLRLR